MPEQQTALLNKLLQSIEPLIGFLGNHPATQSVAIFLIALLVAKLTTTLLTRVIGQFAMRTDFKWDDQVIELIRRPMFWTVIFIGILTALLPLKLSSVTNDVIQSIIATFMIIIWSAFLVRISRIALKSMSQHRHASSLVRPQTQPLFENLGFILILLIAIYFIFRAWHIDMTAWLASAGILGIAIGFAAKDTLANLFSGVFILADAPYKLGDYVVLDGGERGKVTAIGLRSTRLVTRDDVEVTIPNAIMGNTRIINESGGPHEKFRIRVSVGVAYGSDIDQVKSILMDIAQAEPQVCDDPEPRVRFRRFGASSLDVDLMCWVYKPEERGRVIDILNTAIYKQFNTEGIEIPYSKQDVYIRAMPESD
ncbi:MAG: mechanosensitive ion channel family protein [Gammaproteobacteria bacterium]|nr:mechanosensitive ion channel family protein [Gammaproteobacteria bacterium]